jgi:hypothetical protein
MMADIDVVPKHRSNLWLWIVLAIIVIALIIWAVAGRSHTTTGLRQAPLPSAAQLHSAPPAALPA